ncbi:YggT family protein [Hahella sp. CCB-MM4]|uniref:YggT family protein n=1 Tax=Hahella sp. (strain CCB-MM4) TaxID=1926491 RepID=UPI000B9AC51C|nr:YggT family protein [Hahella sp. CCB-MM4]OZG74261.1 YggT family protein [Hahella sp. CCB-MM4]
MLSQIAISTIQILASFYITIVILRFLLQLSRADFYNPISQFVVKATNPFVIPLRRIIPGMGGLDIASLVLAILLQLLTYVLLLALRGSGIPLTLLLPLALLKVLDLTVQVYFWAIIAVIVLSWIAPGSYHPAAQLLYQLTEPVMRPFRKILPNLGGLDLSPILVFLVINAINIVISHLQSMVIH